MRHVKHTHILYEGRGEGQSKTLPHTATHCNTLQNTATHYNTLQHTATHCNTLQHTATYTHSLLEGHDESVLILNNAVVALDHCFVHSCPVTRTVDHLCVCERESERVRERGKVRERGRERARVL